MKAVSYGGGSDGEGGGMFVSGESTMALANCNFTQCVAQGGASSSNSFFGFAGGGGLDVDYLSTVAVSNTTFTHDQAWAALAVRAPVAARVWQGRMPREVG